MEKYDRNDVAYGLEKSVEETPESYGWNEWRWYDEYVIGGEQGQRYIYAPDAHGAYPYKPLSLPTASLFLEFARWPEEYGMDRWPLDSDANAEAALQWAPGRGILGTARPNFKVWGSSSEVLREFLGGHGEGIRRSRGLYNDGRGGPKETVERFAVEAWKANMVLSLHDAATRPAGPEMDTIVGLMPDRKGGPMKLPTIREIHGTTPERAHDWALALVEEIVEDETRAHCWLIPVRRNDGTHGQGWAFDSLLGAMWMQMQWLMLGQSKRCKWCGEVLDVDPEQDLRTIRDTETDKAGPRKPRSDRGFCRGTTCRQKWNYHRGQGRSSKRARKETRDRERERS